MPIVNKTVVAHALNFERGRISLEYQCVFRLDQQAVFLQSDGEVWGSAAFLFLKQLQGEWAIGDAQKELSSHDFTCDRVRLLATRKKGRTMPTGSAFDEFRVRLMEQDYRRPGFSRIRVRRNSERACSSGASVESARSWIPSRSQMAVTFA